jgi:hypothetical protein
VSTVAAVVVTIAGLLPTALLTVVTVATMVLRDADRRQSCTELAGILARPAWVGLLAAGGASGLTEALQGAQALGLI